MNSDSSTETTVENDGAKTPDVKDSSAGSSPPEAVAEKPDKGEPAAKGEKGNILDAVKAALKPKEKAPASEETDSKPAEKPDAAKEGEGDKTGELTPEEESQLKPRTKKRIDTLLADRAERDKTITELQPKAQQFDKLVEWVREADLSSEEVNQTFDIARNLKHGNFRAAFDAIAPIYRNLQAALGEVLPDDLQQRVARGEIDEATARRLATAETEKVIAERRLQRTTEVSRQQREQQATESYVNSVKTAVTEWESSKSKADPDWKLKQGLVTQAIELAIHRQGYPKTTADAVKIADAALAEVNKTFAQMAPRKKEVQAVTDVASSRSTAVPKTMLEAAKAGLAKARAGG